MQIRISLLIRGEHILSGNVFFFFFSSRSPKRRRSRSNSRTRRSRHRRSRSRSRDRRHHSPRSRSQERREREKERERRQKGLPPPKSETLSSESSSIYGLMYSSRWTWTWNDLFGVCSMSFNNHFIPLIPSIAYIFTFLTSRYLFLSLFQFAVQLSGWASWTREHNSKMSPVYWRSLGR